MHQNQSRQASTTHHNSGSRISTMHRSQPRSMASEVASAAVRRASVRLSGSTSSSRGSACPSKSTLDKAKSPSSCGLDAATSPRCARRPPACRASRGRGDGARGTQLLDATISGPGMAGTLQEAAMAGRADAIFAPSAAMAGTAVRQDDQAALNCSMLRTERKWQDLRPTFAC